MESVVAINRITHLKFSIQITVPVRSPKTSCFLDISESYATRYGTARTFMPMDPVLPGLGMDQPCQART